MPYNCPSYYLGVGGDEGTPFPTHLKRGYMHEIEKLKAEKYKIIGVIQDLQKQTRQIDKQIKELLKNENNQNSTNIS